MFFVVRCLRAVSKVRYRLPIPFRITVTLNKDVHLSPRASSVVYPSVSMLGGIRGTPSFPRAARSGAAGRHRPSHLSDASPSDGTNAQLEKSACW